MAEQVDVLAVANEPDPPDPAHQLDYDSDNPIVVDSAAWQDALNAKFGVKEDEEEEEVEGTTPPSLESLAEETSPAEETPPAPEHGLSPEQIAAYTQFDTLLANNPALSQYVNAVLNGELTVEQATQQAQQALAPVAETPPPDLDLDDPNIKHLWDQYQAQGDMVRDLRQRVETHDDFLQRQHREANESYINRATASFKERFELSDEEVQHISQIAGGLEILPALKNGFNPLTGQYERPDAIAAVERALEIAYWNHPEYRNREYQRQMDQQKTDNKRKQKLAAVSGNSGSVPRSRPTPQTREGRHAAMVQEVEAAMSGNIASGD